MSENFFYEVRKNGDVCILDLYGKITGHRAYILKEELIRLKDAGISKIVLNFQGITSMDSVGTMEIACALRKGLLIRTIYANSLCRQLLEQEKTTRGITFLGSEEEAINKLSGNHSVSKEMRRYKRITTNFPAEISISHNRQRGLLLNISEGGALIGYLDPIDQDSHSSKKINIKVEFPVIGAIVLDGRPVRFGRSGEMYVIGLELFGPDDNRKLMKHFGNGVPDSPDQPPAS